MEINKEELTKNLEILYQTENRIAETIKKCGLRFSTNKLTGDLGEFYAYDSLSKQKIFEFLKPQTNSNADFDLLGNLAKESILFDHFEKSEIRIEIKTRRNQEGTKYLSSLKPEKFELLCVVDIAKDYTLNKIYLVKSETAEKFLDKKYKRLIFKESMAFMSI